MREERAIGHRVDDLGKMERALTRVVEKDTSPAAHQFPFITHVLIFHRDMEGASNKEICTSCFIKLAAVFTHWYYGLCLPFSIIVISFRFVDGFFDFSRESCSQTDYPH